MKKRKRDELVQFWVTSDEKKVMQDNAARNGMDDLSKYFRVLGLAKVQISVSVAIPNIMQVSEANLSPGMEVERSRKRAAGQ